VHLVDALFGGDLLQQAMEAGVTGWPDGARRGIQMNSTPLALSPVDYVFAGVGSYAIEFAFAYQGTIDPVPLQRSLDKTLQEFWPLRSKLARISENAYEFQTANDGLFFQTSRTSEIFEDAEDVSGFVASVDSVVGEPLTKIKLTQTPRGSVLGVSVSHALVDGFSLFHFLGSWSRIFHDQRFLSPACDRQQLTPRLSGTQGVVTPDEVLARCGLFWAGKRRPVPKEQLREERIFVSKERMNELLAEAKQDCEVALFHNDALTAWLWRRCVPQWETGDGNPSTYMTCPVDFRRILKAVPRTYLGNALCFATAAMDYVQLANASLGELALLIREAVGQVRQAYVSGSLQTLERLRRQRGPAVMEEVHVVPPQHGMLVTNISRLPMRSLDFGAGIPTAFRALSSSQRGAAILPAIDGVEIRIFHPVVQVGSTQRVNAEAQGRRDAGQT
jgi:shikimate O-hydroxycinnamoyltransferase